MTVFGAGSAFGAFFAGDDDRKKLRIPPPFDGGGGATWTGAGAGGGSGGALALNWAIIWGSRRTLIVSVNSSLLCSILALRV